MPSMSADTWVAKTGCMRNQGGLNVLLLLWVLPRLRVQLFRRGMSERSLKTQTLYGLKVQLTTLQGVMRKSKSGGTSFHTHISLVRGTFARHVVGDLPKDRDRILSTWTAQIGGLRTSTNEMHTPAS